jgi:hypothetical protein
MSDEHKEEQASLHEVAPKWPSARLPWALAACFALTTAIFFVTTMYLEINSAGYREDAVRFDRQLGMLRKHIKHLENKDGLAGMKIALLDSLLADTPKAAAVFIWDKEKQNGLLVGENLSSLPAHEDYQLWLIDSKSPSPINAGVFQVSAKGTVQFRFTPKEPVNFEKVTVTRERKGGAPKPEGQMVLTGS